MLEHTKKRATIGIQLCPLVVLIIRGILIYGLPVNMLEGLFNYGLTSFLIRYVAAIRNKPDFPDWALFLTLRVFRYKSSFSAFLRQEVGSTQ